MHGCVDAWMHGCMDAWMRGCMDAWTPGFETFPYEMQHGAIEWMEVVRWMGASRRIAGCPQPALSADDDAGHVAGPTGKSVSWRALLTGHGVCDLSMPLQDGSRQSCKGTPHSVYSTPSPPPPSPHAMPPIPSVCPICPPWPCRLCLAQALTGGSWSSTPPSLRCAPLRWAPCRPACAASQRRWTGGSRSSMPAGG